MGIFPLEDLFTSVGNVVAPFPNPGLQYETISLMAHFFRDEGLHEIVSHTDWPKLLPPHTEGLLLVHVVGADFPLSSRFSHVLVHHLSLKVTWLHHHVLYEIPSLLRICTQLSITVYFGGMGSLTPYDVREAVVRKHDLQP